MQHPFEARKSIYENWVASARVRPECQRLIDHVCDRLVGFIDQGHYDEGCKATGVPIAWAAASFEREASSNFLCSPAQGDRWDRVSKNVPRGLGPYPDFKSAQIAAYKIDGLDKNSYPWTWGYSLYAGEKFNGFGYADFHGIPTPYDVGGTTAQKPGKYTSDGHYDPTVDDGQIGILPLMIGIVARRPALALLGPQPGALTGAPIIVPPQLVVPPSGLAALRPIKWTQAALNRIAQDLPQIMAAIHELGGPDQIRVDGDYGKQTRLFVRGFEKAEGLQVDAGYAGPAVFGVLDRLLGAGWQPPAQPAPAPVLDRPPPTAQPEQPPQQRAGDHNDSEA